MLLLTTITLARRITWFTLADIALTGRDSDFEPVREEVRRMLLELNLTLSRRAQEAEVAGGLGSSSF
jgi:hypothetical protein